jgi:hypothetical protein
VGHRQLLIILLFDVAIAFAIARLAGPRGRGGLGSLALIGVVALPFAFLAAAPFFLSRSRPAAAPSPAAMTACPLAARASASGPAVSQLRVVPGWVAGSVDHSQITENSALFCGWAASVKARRVADSVLVLSDGRFVGAIRPTISRPDVVKAQGPVGANSGFSVQLPLSVLQHANKKAKVQLFGIEGGVASALPFVCASKPQNFGC